MKKTIALAVIVISSLTAFTSCCQQKQPDLFVCRVSPRYHIKAYSIVDEKAGVLMFDMETKKYQMFIYDPREKWVFGETYPENVVEHGERCSYEIFRCVFMDHIIEDSLYGF